MKRYWAILMVIIIAIIGFLMGIYLHRVSSVNRRTERDYAETKKYEEDVQIAEIIEQGLLTAIEASQREERTSPGCMVTMRTFYKDCEHALENTAIIEEQFVNLNEEEFRKEHADWEIQEFTSNSIVIYREINDFCGEHYRIRDLDR